MSPFEAIGERARWRTLYDEILTRRNIGDIITYDEMAETLDLDSHKDRHAMQMAMRRAAKEYEVENLRALDSVPNVGYRVVEPTEHLGLARRQQKRSHRALARGHSKVVHVDVSGMETETRKAFEIVAQAFAMQMDFNRRMDVRQSRLEKAVDSIIEEKGRTSEEIAALHERLARLEGKPEA